ncbi:MAG: glycosyltransferase [Gammaproteobacteria bacterium]|nr:glycosyltransferase [Gammaproteobacteria bacterium]
MNILFSIITVCLNDKQGVADTGRSIARQSCADYEWLVIDGGSSDGTAEYLSQLNDDRLRWLSQPDDGLYDAMNKGIELASGEYLLFLNAGDRLADNSTLQALSEMIVDAGRADFIYGDAQELTQGGQLLVKKARSHKHIWYGMFTHHQAMLYKRSAIGEIRYRLEYPIGADYAFTAEVLKASRSIARIDRAVCIFQQGGLSSRTVAQGADDQWRIRRDVLGIPYPGRLVIRVIHGVAHVMKTRLPVIYKRLRFS